MLYQQNVKVTPEQVRASFRFAPQLKGIAPHNHPTRSYTFDGEREGVLNAPTALQWVQTNVAP